MQWALYHETVYYMESDAFVFMSTMACFTKPMLQTLLHSDDNDISVYISTHKQIWMSVKLDFQTISAVKMPIVLTLKGATIALVMMDSLVTE